MDPSVSRARRPRQESEINMNAEHNSRNLTREGSPIDTITTSWGKRGGKRRAKRPRCNIHFKPKPNLNPTHPQNNPTRRPSLIIDRCSPVCTPALAPTSKGRSSADDGENVTRRTWFAPYWSTAHRLEPTQHRGGDHADDRPSWICAPCRGRNEILILCRGNLSLRRVYVPNEDLPNTQRFLWRRCLQYLSMSFTSFSIFLPTRKITSH
ncbi:hypothetical protein BDZ97DRAFT_1800689 [Flammula alnicola]|nr:hypothetical protein BDZ97DRAFT_1800689 [Flammula alnicola]